MSETKKLTIVGIVLAVLFAIGIGIYAFDKNGGNKQYSSTSSKNEYKIYYLGRAGCGYCQMFQPNIDSIKKNYNIDYEYIDIEKISSQELADYLKKFNVNSDEFGTPTIAIMKGDELISSHIGYLSEQALYNYLKSNNAITGDYISPYPNLKYINFDDYKQIVESNDKQLVVIAQEGCTGCDEAQEVLNTLAKEQGLKVNYYNVSFETEDDYNYFYNSYEYIKKALDNETLYTPTFMIVENKKVIDALEKYESKDALTNLLKKNGLIK